MSEIATAAKRLQDRKAAMGFANSTLMSRDESSEALRRAGIGYDVDVAELAKFAEDVSPLLAMDVLSLMAQATSTVAQLEILRAAMAGTWTDGAMTMAQLFLDRREREAAERRAEAG